jgi:hypothetical protein
VASARDVAIYLREDCRTLRDSLQLEMVVAQYCLRIRDVLTTAGVRVGDAVGAGVIAELEGQGDPLSHAILLGVAHLGLGEPAARGAEAAARLTERAVGVPQEFAGVGRSRAVGAWRTCADLYDEMALFAEFDYPRGERHTIALFVDQPRGGAVKHIGLLGAMHELDPGGPFDPHALETIDIPRAGALMRDALEVSHGPGAAASHDYRVLIAWARARSMQHRERAS